MQEEPSEKLVGVIGGLGPMATVYFQEMVLEMTSATQDQDHVNMLVSNHASIPDRTAYLLQKSDESPAPKMIADAQMLAQAGCSFLVVPCNTAHAFYSSIQQEVSIPLLNIVEETVLACAQKSMQTIGLLATEGTVFADLYGQMCRKHGLSCTYPDEATQGMVTAVIYDRIKAGLPASVEELTNLYDRMRNMGCDGIVLGCTELPVAHRDLGLQASNPDVIDSLEVLARRTIERAGKQVRPEYRSV